MPEIEETKAITVCYREQNVESVHNVPDGFVLFCRDYDVEHIDPDCIPGGFHIDIDGNEYALTTWTPNETKEPPTTKQPSLF